MKQEIILNKIKIKVRADHKAEDNKDRMDRIEADGLMITKVNQVKTLRDSNHLREDNNHNKGFLT